MRIFFTNLERTNPSEFRALVDYLTDPGKDPLELAPVIVASEYDPADPAQIIPLDALLRRKLAVDDPIRVPWQFGSIDPPRRRAAVNSQILESKGFHRYEFALKNVAITPDEYPRYLRLISTIWDRSAEVTRYNLPKPDYRKTLMTLLGESKLDDRELGAGERLREALSIGKLTFNDGREITQFRSNVSAAVGTRTNFGKRP